MSTNVAEAAEAVESHLHPTPSWSVDDHPTPTGLEEIWRFTPLHRMKALLGGEPTGDRLAWEQSIPEGVSVSTIDEDAAEDVAEDAAAADAKTARTDESEPSDGSAFAFAA